MTDTICVFDLELDSLRSDGTEQITQIAAIARRNGEVVDSFNVRVQFDVARADKEALEITGYSPEKWAHALIPKNACIRFGDWLKKHASIEKIAKSGKPYRVAQGCGYNAASFDFPRLQTFFQNHGQFLPMDYGVLDVLHLARWFFRLSDGPKPDNLKLGTLAGFLGVPLDNAHDALADVHATANVAAVLISRLEVLNG